MLVCYIHLSSGVCSFMPSWIHLKDSADWIGRYVRSTVKILGNSYWLTKLCQHLCQLCIWSTSSDLRSPVNCIGSTSSDLKDSADWIGRYVRSTVKTLGNSYWLTRLCQYLCQFCIGSTSSDLPIAVNCIGSTSSGQPGRCKAEGWSPTRITLQGL